MSQVNEIFARIMSGTMIAHIDGTGGSGPRSWSELGRAWEFEPVLIFALLVSGWVYRRGVRRLWNEAGRGSGLKRWEVA